MSPLRTKHVSINILLIDVKNYIHEIVCTLYLNPVAKLYYFSHCHSAQLQKLIAYQLDVLEQHIAY